MYSTSWKNRKEQVQRYFDQNVKPKGIAGLLHWFGQFFRGRIPKDSQMDRWVAEAQDDVRKIALERLSIDKRKLQRRKPFEVRSPVRGARWFKGKDNKPRSSRIRLTQVFLLDYYLACYRATYDLAEQAVMYDETEEFPYEEITGFGTK